MKISLIIPCYNEKDNLPLLFAKCANLYQTDEYEVIIVDNGSTDGSEEVIKELLKKYEFIKTLKVPENKGYGYGILQGLNIASGDVIGWTHADLQADPCDVIKAYELFIKHGTDIFVKGVRHGRSFTENFFTLGMSFLGSFILRKKLWDINAQPTLFAQSFLKDIINPPTDFSLDLYVYYLAKKLNKKIFRFPVYFGKRISGNSKWNINLKSRLKFIKATFIYMVHLKRMSSNADNCA